MAQDELLSVVTNYIFREVPNGLEQATPLLNYFMSDKGKKKRDGGAALQFPIKLLENKSSGFVSMDGTDILNLTPSDQLRNGVLNYKAYAFIVNFTLKDFALTGGSDDKVGFISEKVQGALEDKYNELNAAFHGSAVSDPLKFDGLLDIVAASGTPYGGLTDTDYTADAYLPVFETGTIVNYALITKMQNQLRARKRNKKNVPVFGLANVSLYSKIQSIFQNHEVAMNIDSLFAVGFEGFKVNGADFYLDPDTPGSQDGQTADNYLYLLPMDCLKFHYVYGPGTKSEFDGEVRIPQQFVKSTQNVWVGNLVCNSRRSVAVAKTLVA